MKKNTLIIVFVFVFILYNSSIAENYDFKQFVWGDSQDKILEVEGSPEEYGKLEGNPALYYDKLLAGMDTQLAYAFNENGLYFAGYILNVKHTQGDKYISDYNTLKGALIDKYGYPKYDIESWDSDDNKEYYTKGDALIYGHLMYITRFFTDTTQITLWMDSDNFQVQTSLFYQSLNSLGNKYSFLDDL